MRRRVTTSKGSVTVEFAFVIVLMLLIIAGTFAFGRTFWYSDALTKSTRDGARVLSTWQMTTDTSNGVSTAKTTVINLANAANLNPQLTTANVVAECDYGGVFAFTPCVPALKPVNVRVSITGFSVQLAALFPFVDTTAVNNSTSINLSPHTTMRYMN